MFRILTNVNPFCPPLYIFITQHLFLQFLFEKLSRFYYVSSLGSTINIAGYTFTTGVKGAFLFFQILPVTTPAHRRV